MEGGYSQTLLVDSQYSHLGRPSLHLILRRLQLRHPCLDLLCERRTRGFGLDLRADDEAWDDSKLFDLVLFSGGFKNCDESDEEAEE